MSLRNLLVEHVRHTVRIANVTVEVIGAQVTIQMILIEEAVVAELAQRMGCKD